jgi:hypothetical protein
LLLLSLSKISFMKIWIKHILIISLSKNALKMESFQQRRLCICLSKLNFKKHLFNFAFSLHWKSKKMIRIYIKTGLKE